MSTKLPPKLIPTPIPEPDVVKEPDVIIEPDVIEHTREHPQIPLPHDEPPTKKSK